ncbi:MAG: VCBS repeat-containing protein [Flavobacteriales bacterium]|nr:VCBS repeat-containing protein [Flavobacteriales bacterium]
MAPFFVDIDGDGKRDLVVAPNSSSAAENAHGIWYYRNTGTDAAPVFNFQQDDLFQGDMLDFGEGARPVLFDHNSDGLMDLVVANEGYYLAGGFYSGKLALLENTGTPTAPLFNLITDDYAQLSGLGFGPGMHPAFGDVDGDGHPDMIIGDGDNNGDNSGRLHFFHNTSGGPVAQFQLTQALMTDDNGTVIDVGANATPQLFDLDGDGLLDLIVGERNGNLNYYRNAGTAQAPSWHLESQLLGAVRVNEYWSTTGYSVPFLYMDGQGQKKCISGSESGGIHLYDGITGNEGGSWNLVDSVWGELHEGGRTAVALYDFTGDGQLDAVIGNYRGGLSFWSSGIWTGVDAAIPETAENVFSLAPNPANSTVDILMHTPSPEHAG